MFRRLIKLYKRIFHPEQIVPTVGEAAVLQFEEAQRRLLHYKKAREDARALVAVSKERIDRLGRDIASMMKEPEINIEIRPEVRRADRNKNGSSKRTALQQAQYELEQEERFLLTYHTESEDAEGQVDILTKRLSRLRTTIAKIAVKAESEDAIATAAADTTTSEPRLSLTGMAMPGAARTTLAEATVGGGRLAHAG